jgi:hypothetical protein
VFNYTKSKYTHILYIESLVKYVVSVIDYNISLFRTASRSNYAIIDYNFQESPSNVVRGKNLVTVSSYRSATSYKNVISSCDRLWLFRR